MNFAAVVNSSAGLASRQGPVVTRMALTEALGKQLVSLRVVKPRAVPAALDEALALKPDAILVLGGDGTARSAATKLLPTGVPAAFLPGGTMNILPTRLYGEAPLDQILKAIAQGNVSHVQLRAGLAGSQPFFVAATFGFLPYLATVRERLRRARSIGARAHAIQQMLRFSAPYFERPVGFTAPGQGMRLSSGLVAGLGDLDALHPLREPHVTLDHFECASLDVTGWSGLLRLSLTALARRDWRNHPHVTPFTTERLDVFAGRRVRATLDGEPCRLRGPLTLRFAARGMAALALPAKLDEGAVLDPHRASV